MPKGVLGPPPSFLDSAAACMQTACMRSCQHYLADYAGSPMQPDQQPDPVLRVCLLLLHNADARLACVDHP